MSLLSQLGSLAVLDLQNNAVQSVPPELGNLTQLRALQLEVPLDSPLDLQNNAVQSVPPELGNLTQLRALQLEVPLDSPLDLQNNAVQSVPPELGNLTQLRALQLEVQPFKQTVPWTCRTMLSSPSHQSWAISPSSALFS
jgi:internalin A